MFNNKISFTFELEIIAGVSLKDAIADALRISKMLNIHVKFRFNGIGVNIYPNSDAAPAEIDWDKVESALIDLVQYEKKKQKNENI